MVNIGVAQVGAVKIYAAAAAVGATRREKERQQKTQFTTKIGEKTSLGPSYFTFVKFSFPITRLTVFDFLVAVDCSSKPRPFLYIKHSHLKKSNVYYYYFLK
jgi:hypothetical protein